MPRYGITLGYQKDKCSVCKFIKEVRIIFDNDEHKAVKICDTCVNEQGSKNAEQIVKEYGKKTSANQIKILTKEQMEKSGFETSGLKPKKKKN